MSEGNRRRPRTLNEDEAALWEFAMRGAKSLRPREPTSLLGIDDEDVVRAVNRLAKTASIAEQLQTPNPAPSKPKLTAVEIAELDRRQTRLIATGRAAIDARLDLHGMRQQEAHAALKSFLHSAQSRGARVVLVITGKGGRRKTSEREFFPYSDDEPGVLKRLTPRWLQDADLRHLVVSFGASSAQHGGDGALYVRLRKPR
ncbi:MAG: Smr/MutS family protein [Hyphomicrobiales bacterium]|nr:Smr/MutS family protein [Hyphomicrobiales bacterium]